MAPEPVKVTTEPRPCPEKEVLYAYFYKRLFGKLNERVLEHIKTCDPCLNQLAALQAEERRRAQTKPAVPQFAEVASRRR